MLGGWVDLCKALCHSFPATYSTFPPAARRGAAWTGMAGSPASCHRCTAPPMCTWPALGCSTWPRPQRSASSAGLCCPHTARPLGPPIVPPRSPLPCRQGTQACRPHHRPAKPCIGWQVAGAPSRQEPGWQPSVHWWENPAAGLYMHGCHASSSKHRKPHHSVQYCTAEVVCWAGHLHDASARCPLLCVQQRQASSAPRLKTTGLRSTPALLLHISPL